MATTQRRVDMRNVITVIIIAIILGSGLLLMGRAISYVSAWWAGSPAPVVQHYAVGQKLQIGSAHVQGISSWVDVQAVDGETITLHNEIGNVAKCPANALGSLEAMDNNCLIQSGGTWAAAPVAPASQAIPAGMDPACYYAAKYELNCDEVKQFRDQYWKLNHPEVLDGK